MYNNDIITFNASYILLTFEEVTMFDGGNMNILLNSIK